MIFSVTEIVSSEGNDLIQLYEQEVEGAVLCQLRLLSKNGNATEITLNDLDDEEKEMLINHIQRASKK